MTSHAEYIQDQDADQLAHLIEVATKRRNDIVKGGWVTLWVVADYANQGWFEKSAYAEAVEFMSRLGQHHMAAGKCHELSLTETRVRPVETEELFKATAIEIARLDKAIKLPR